MVLLVKSELEIFVDASGHSLYESAASAGSLSRTGFL